MRCAIAGCGRIGSTLEDDPLREKPASHAGAVRYAGKKLVAACDLNPARLALFSKRWKLSRVYPTLEQMLNENEIDILIIATPPETHENLLRSASSFPLKAIILEKPLAHTIESARAVSELCTSRSLPLIINHERRFANQYVHIKNLIDSGCYGKLLSLSMKLYMGSSRSFREILYDDGTHILDLAHYLCGDFIITQVHGDERSLFAGALAAESVISFEAGRKRDHLLFEIDCSFETGRITAGNGYYHEYASKPSPFYRNFRSLIRENRAFKKTAYFANMFDHACRVAEGIEKSRSSAADALFALTCVESILSKMPAGAVSPGS